MSNPVAVSYDEQAYRQGYAAGAAGKPRSNPYMEDGTTRALSWISGYIEGKANPDRLPQMRPMGPRINGDGRV